MIDELNQRNETQQRNLQDYKIAESNIDEVKNEIRANNAAYNKNLNANTVKFLTVARLVPQKNISLLLRAFQEVHLHFPQDSLTVVGNGFLKSDLMKLADSLNISEVVHFVGKTDNIEQFYEVHDVFVLSSLYEGFGLVLLESMLNKTPWAARFGSGARLLQAHGFTYRNDNQLIEYLNNFTPSTNQIETAYEHVKQYHMIDYYLFHIFL